MPQAIIYSNDVGQALAAALAQCSYSTIAVIADANTARYVLPAIKCSALASAATITIGAGDEHKNLNTLQHVWTSLEQSGATRQSLVINIGGGVVTDLGGFAAATFKRGIRFINVPTTLLAAVDAAVGGKTGINFNGLKNEVGVFQPASHVIISTAFFPTLPLHELKSGFAEMLKHAMLSGDRQFAKLIEFDFNAIDYDKMLPIVEQSVKVKQRIVEQDPNEHGLRRALNLGHTVGHAFESQALRRGKPVAHGYAVAWGLVAETVLSHLRYKFPSSQLHKLARFVRDNYGAYYITCNDYDELLSLMHHDKKSRNGEINCSLLAACGNIKVDNAISNDEMREALDIYRDLMGI